MNRKTLLQALFVCVALVLVLVILYSGLQILESTVFLKTPDTMQTTTKTIKKDGVSYYPRQDITTVMLMGINRTGPVQETEFNHGGAVDMVALMIFDEKTQECSLLALNRDMMVDMPILNEYGKEVGVYYGQLAYSHTYGDGLERSCENVRKTVSNLLGGVSVDHYVALNMDTIALINDAVGGVTVNVTDDFSQIDTSIPRGRVTLLGEQAVHFVQARWFVGDELNLSRMRRQEEYISNFVPQLRRTIEEQPGFVVSTYEDVAEYIVTDCSVSVLSRLEGDFSEYAVGEMLSISGENVLGEEFYEFYPDEEALEELILRLFYTVKE